MSSTLKSRLGVLAAALLFSTGGAAIKAASLTSWQVTSFRCGVAALVVLAVLPRSRARPTLASLLAALAYATTMVLFVHANKTTTAANAIFLQSTAPIWMVLLAPKLLGETVRARDLAFLVVFAAGLGLFFVDATEPQATAPDPWQGDVVATLSGLSWALTVLGLRFLERADPGGSASALLLGNGIGFLGCLPFALPVTTATAADGLVVLYLGGFQVGLAYLCLSTGVRGVPAIEASLLLLLEPVLNPVWAFAVHGETPGRLSLAGGAVILAATVAQTWLDARRRNRLALVEGA